MAEIIINDLVILKPKELSEILYKNEYFGFVEDALAYALKKVTLNEYVRYALDNTIAKEKLVY